MTSRWLSPEVFDWEVVVDFAEQVTYERFARPHLLLTHAESALAQDAGELARADAVFALKRAVNSRLKHIEELYGLAKAFPKSVGALERLEAVDLARPLLVRQLFELRNDIEHNDGPVPAAQRCHELADATWYFLRATDAACSELPSGLEFRPADADAAHPTDASKEFVSLHKIAPGLDRLTITARLRKGQISFSPVLGHIEVRNSPEFRDRLRETLKRSHMEVDHVGDQEWGPSTDRVHFGELVFDDSFRRTIWRRLFQCHRLRSTSIGAAQ